MVLNFDFLLTAIIFGWLGVLTLFNIWAFLYYKRLTQGAKKKNLLLILEKLLKDLEIESEKIKDLIEGVKNLENEIVSHVQKVGLVRFNPFAETGGDQSFCLALLDANNSGVVVSSLHSRDATRVYAKPVKAGKEAGYALSEEEKRAIKGAKKIK
jgi:hypothetical protein